MRREPITRLTKQYDQDRCWEFLDALADAELRCELLTLSTGLTLSKEEYELPEIYSMFKSFDKECVGKSTCHDLPGFCSGWYDKMIGKMIIHSHKDLCVLLNKVFKYISIEDIETYVDILLKVVWFKLNYYNEYVRISKIAWLWIGVHNSYILDIIPSDNKDTAQKLLADDPDEDILLNLNRGILDKYIKNQDISEYFMCLRFSVMELVSIVDKAYIDIRVKLETYKWMEKLLDVPQDVYKMFEDWNEEQFDEARMENKYTGVSTYCKAFLQSTRIIYQKIIDLLYKNNNIIYMAIEQPSKSKECLERNEFDYFYHDPNAELFTSISDLTEWVEGSYNIDDCNYLGYYIAAYSLSSVRPTKIMDFCMELSSGNLIIYSFYIGSSYYSSGEKLEEEICNQLDISKEILRFYKEEILGTYWDITGLKLPYDYGDIIKVQTPMMEEADFAVYKPDMDGNGRWYNWLGYIEKEDKDVIVDLGYQELNMSNVYVTWDWISKVEEIPIV